MRAPARAPPPMAFDGTTAPTTNGLIHNAVRRLSAALDPWQDGDRDRGAQLERAFADLHRS